MVTMLWRSVNNNANPRRSILSSTGQRVTMIMHDIVLCRHWLYGNLLSRAATS